MGMAWNEHDLGCGCGVIPVPHKVCSCLLLGMTGFCSSLSGSCSCQYEKAVDGRRRRPPFPPPDDFFHVLRVASRQARLLHWSCAGKPWRRIKEGLPCSIDTHYWQVGGDRCLPFHSHGMGPDAARRALLPFTAAAIHSLFPRFLTAATVSQPWDLVGKVQPKQWCDDGDLPQRLEKLPILHPKNDDVLDGSDVGDELVYFEQLFNRPKRRCPGPVKIPHLHPVNEDLLPTTL